METVSRQYEIYTYSELSDSAKEKALQDHNQWAEIDLSCELDNYKEIGAALGIDIEDIYYSLAYCQGDGASFTGSYAYKKGALAYTKKEWPLWLELHEIAQDLQDIQKPYFYNLYANITANRMHSIGSNISVDGEPGYGYEYHLPDSAEESIKDALRDFMHLIYVGLLGQYEYETSEEYFLECCDCNEWVFLDNGELFS